MTQVQLCRKKRCWVSSIRSRSLLSVQSWAQHIPEVKIFRLFVSRHNSNNRVGGSIPSSKSSLKPKDNHSSFTFWWEDLHVSQSSALLWLLFWSQTRWKQPILITSNRQERKAWGWQHQTNTPISHCFLLQEHHKEVSYLHCRGRDEPFSTSTSVQSATVSTNQRAEDAHLFWDAPCDQRPTPSFPHPCTNCPSLWSEKFDFQTSRPSLPVPPPPNLHHHPPHRPHLQPWEEEAHVLGWGWSSLAAPTWRPAAG